MRDKKKGNRILICGIALSICLFVLAGGFILHLSETFIRSGIVDMAGAVGIAAPEQLGGVMHLYKSGDGLRAAGEEIIGQYGYGRDVYSFVPAWFGQRHMPSLSVSYWSCCFLFGFTGGTR